MLGTERIRYLFEEMGNVINRWKYVQRKSWRKLARGLSLSDLVFEMR